jgi:hypothetical protein
MIKTLFISLNLEFYTIFLVFVVLYLALIGGIIYVTTRQLKKVSLLKKSKKPDST